MTFDIHVEGYIASTVIAASGQITKKWGILAKNPDVLDYAILQVPDDEAEYVAALYLKKEKDWELAPPIYIDSMGCDFNSALDTLARILKNRYKLDLEKLGEDFVVKLKPLPPAPGK